MSTNLIYIPALASLAYSGYVVVTNTVPVPNNLCASIFCLGMGAAFSIFLVGEYAARRDKE